MGRKIDQTPRVLIYPRLRNVLWLISHITGRPCPAATGLEPQAYAKALRYTYQNAPSTHFRLCFDWLDSCSRGIVNARRPRLSWHNTGHDRATRAHPFPDPDTRGVMSTTTFEPPFPT